MQTFCVEDLGQSILNILHIPKKSKFMSILEEPSIHMIDICVLPRNFLLTMVLSSNVWFCFLISVSLFETIEMLIHV